MCGALSRILGLLWRALQEPFCCHEYLYRNMIEIIPFPRRSCYP